MPFRRLDGWLSRWHTYDMKKSTPTKTTPHVEVDSRAKVLRAAALASSRRYEDKVSGLLPPGKSLEDLSPAERARIVAIATTDVQRDLRAHQGKEKTSVVKTTVRLDRTLWREARMRAFDEDRDFQDLVSAALTAYLKGPIAGEGSR